MSKIENQVLEFIFQGKDAGLTGLATKIEKTLDGMHDKMNAVTNVTKDRGLFETMLRGAAGGSPDSAIKQTGLLVTSAMDRVISAYADYQVQMVSVRRETTATNSEQREFSRTLLENTAKYGTSMDRVMLVSRAMATGSESAQASIKGTAAELARMGQNTNLADESLEQLSSRLTGSFKPLMDKLGLDAPQMMHWLRVIAEESGMTMNEVVTEFLKLDKVVMEKMPRNNERAAKSILQGFQESFIAASKSMGTGEGTAALITNMFFDDRALEMLQSKHFDVELVIKQTLDSIRDRSKAYGDWQSQVAVHVGDGMDRIIGAIEDGKSHIDEYDEELGKALKSTEAEREAWTKAHQTSFEKFGDAINHLKNSITSTFQEVGSAFTSWIEPALAKITGFINSFADLISVDLSGKLGVAFEQLKISSINTWGRIGQLLFGDISMSEFLEDPTGEAYRRTQAEILANTPIGKHASRMEGARSTVEQRYRDRDYKFIPEGTLEQRSGESSEAFRARKAETISNAAMSYIAFLGKKGLHGAPDSGVLAVNSRAKAESDERLKALQSSLDGVIASTQALSEQLRVNTTATADNTRSAGGVTIPGSPPK